MTAYHCPSCLSLMSIGTTPAGDDLVYQCGNPRCGFVAHASTVVESCIDAAGLAAYRGQLTTWARGAAVLDDAPYSDLPHPLVWAVEAC